MCREREGERERERKEREKEGEREREREKEGERERRERALYLKNHFITLKECVTTSHPPTICHTHLLTHSFLTHISAPFCPNTSVTCKCKQSNFSQSHHLLLVSRIFEMHKNKPKKLALFSLLCLRPIFLVLIAF